MISTLTVTVILATLLATAWAIVKLARMAAPYDSQAPRDR